ncbi:MG406 family protein [Spiroplasma endosymbiont of Asaphidion curtum]|uniref:MG406 family protein n=1 Tax=Spiroplasma endosymbiont of Asaphidion curtum TaxID=3066281 RepID=UPI00313C5A95
MKNINWKYEKQIMIVFGLLIFIGLLVTTIFTIFNYLSWNLITGFVTTSIFSLLNYLLLIFLTSYVIQTGQSINKLGIGLLFLLRVLLYLIPVLIIMLFNEYFNIFSSIFGLMLAFIATLIVNMYNALIEKRNLKNES